MSSGSGPRERTLLLPCASPHHPWSSPPATPAPAPWPGLFSLPDTCAPPDTRAASRLPGPRRRCLLCRTFLPAGLVLEVPASTPSSQSSPWGTHSPLFLFFLFMSVSPSRIKSRRTRVLGFWDNAWSIVGVGYLGTDGVSLLGKYVAPVLVGDVPAVESLGHRRENCPRPPVPASPGVAQAALSPPCTPHVSVCHCVCSVAGVAAPWDFDWHWCLLLAVPPHG